MAGEGKELTLAEIEQIHRLKTGRLLTFPFVAAGIVAQKSTDEVEKLRQVGQILGLAFQITNFLSVIFLLPQVLNEQHMLISPLKYPYLVFFQAQQKLL